MLPSGHTKVHLAEMFQLHMAFFICPPGHRVTADVELWFLRHCIAGRQAFALTTIVVSLAALCRQHRTIRSGTLLVLTSTMVPCSLRLSVLCRKTFISSILRNALGRRGKACRSLSDICQAVTCLPAMGQWDLAFTQDDGTLVRPCSG